MSEMEQLCPANWSKLLKRVKKQEKEIRVLKDVKLFKDSKLINKDGFITIQIGRVLISCPQDTPEYLELSRNMIELMMQHSSLKETE